jgi:hypothetical protein
MQRISELKTSVHRGLLASVLGAALLLTACGGGGGSSTTPKVRTNPDPGMSITTPTMSGTPTTPGNPPNIYNARYTTGTGWGAAQALESSTRTAQLQRIAMNELGNSTTVWMQFANSTGKQAAAQYFSSGG